MFTSRAEYRLLFNHGSAELRMLDYAKTHGLLSSDRLSRIEAKKVEIEKWVGWLETNRQGEKTWATLIQRESGRGALPEELASVSKEVREEVVYRVKYDGYLKRERRQVEKLNDVERIKVPVDFDYTAVKGLRNESVQKLKEMRPANLGQASRISGVNPADISILMVALDS